MQADVDMHRADAWQSTAVTLALLQNAIWGLLDI